MRRPNRRPPPRRRMLIAPHAIDAFLKRQLDDWRWMKQVPREDLEELVAEGFQFHTKPYLHQLVCYLIGAKLGRFLFLLDMGSGKSKIFLDQVRLRKHLGTLRTALITVPNLINLASWERQIARHAPDLTYKILDGSKKERYEALDEALPDLCLINNAGLGVYMASGMRNTRKGTQKRTLVAEDALQFSDLFNFIGIDESHNGLSSVQSLQYEMLNLLSRRADFCFAATGTVFGRDPEKMWPQFRVVDQGETLGTSLGMFHAAFYKEKFSPYRRGGVEYTFNQGRKMLLRKVIQHRSLRYEDSEVSDLPPVLPPVQIPVQMTSAQIKRNEQLVQQAREAAARDERPNIFVRQRQTAAGFIALRGENELRLEVEFTPNPKIDALEQFLLDLNEDEKLTIFHCYVPSGVFIQNLLTKMKIPFSGVGHGFKDPTKQLRRFTDDWRCRVFVANCTAGGTGVDGLQEVCRYGLFYETPSSPTQRRQSVKRLARDGQKRRVRFYDLVAKGINIDERVHHSLATGHDLFDLVVDGKEKIT